MHSLLSFACVFVTIVASATEVKRGYGCSSEITQSPYTTSDGTTFDLQCNTSYTNTQFLDVTYTTNFSSCMEACVKWDEAVPCVGVQWDHETLSYQGNNYLCYLLWDMSGNSTEEDQIDSAKIRTASPNCSTLGTTYFASTGPRFDVICDREFNFHDLHLSFALDLPSCGDRCVQWNQDNTTTQACVGVTFDLGVLAPTGIENQCWLKWQMEGSGDFRNVSSTNVTVHSMTLQPQFIPNKTESGVVNCPSTSANLGNQTTPPNSSSKTNVGGIVGGTVGGTIAGLIVGVLGVLAWNKYRPTPEGAIPSKARLSQQRQVNEAGGDKI